MPAVGKLIAPKLEDLVARFIRQGEWIAFVIETTDHRKVRAVVSQDDIGLVRENLSKVDGISASWNSQSFPAEVVREVHGGTQRLPTAALGVTGGGDFVVLPSDNTGRTTMERVFEVEINMPAESNTEYLGNRIYVSFDHGYEPLGLQAWRSLLQLLLMRFCV